MQLNLQNIEDVLFLDKKAQALLPEFRSQFDQWGLSKRVPGLQSLGKRTVLEVLNALEPQHLLRLGEYLHDTIVLDKIDPHIVREYEGGLEAQDVLCQYAGFKDFCVTRSKDRMSVLFWR